ncbi:MAG: Uma2 family endonuclease [Spirochaetia bacterium]|jgi:Uma2 family endonuclease|nr:Uma2 family endonuclease [Spirochaetia bacterium]
MIPEKEDDEKYSYADYLTWPDEQRRELINGEVWAMSPAPSTGHQKISLYLTLEVGSFLKGESCDLFVAPFDVRFVKDENQKDQDIFITLQPDLSVICDKSKIDEKGCLGSPDFIVEILSPSTGYKDETQKLSIYEEYGVKEYWIVNPDRETIQVFLHNGTDFDKPFYYKGDEFIVSSVLKGFRISLRDIFQKNLK